MRHRHLGHGPLGVSEPGAARGFDYVLRLQGRTWRGTRSAAESLAALE